MQKPSGLRRAWARVRGLSPHVYDLVIGTVFVIAGFASTSAIETTVPGELYDERDALAYVLIVVATVPYYVRRRAPLPVFLVSATAVAVLSGLGYSEGMLPLVALAGAYTVGAHRPVREAALAGAVMAVLLVGLFFSDSHGFDAGELAFNAALFGSAILLGWNVQSRRMRLLALQQGQDEAARRAAADERLRIAQELHDVVAHSLGVIAVQAGMGSHVIDTDPDEAKRALERISETSRSSLAEIRRLLGVVRDREGAPDYTPAPSLAELPRLVDEVVHSGLRVDLEITDRLDELPAGVELVVYRIVQEALTNTLRHAAAERVAVRLDRRDGRLHVSVADDGRGATRPGSGGGHGLVGMRERAALYGGTVEAGPQPGGGYLVSAEIPLETEPVA